MRRQSELLAEARSPHGGVRPTTSPAPCASILYSKRTHVAALIAMNRPDQLRSHLVKARENGVTQEELIETITHLAFYAGWPNAVSAIAVAKEVFEQK